MTSWLLIALLGISIGAVVHIVDLYLRSDDVFLSPLEPAIVSGIFQSMLWLAIPVVGFEIPSSLPIALLAVLGGALHLASLVFYFRALFSFGDLSIISMLWNLLVAMVPMLAFFFLRESLDMYAYIGIAILFFGASIFSFSKDVTASSIRRVSMYMLGAVFLMGLSMVCLKGVYDHTGYWSGYLWYTFGIVGGAVAVYFVFFPKQQTRRFHRTIRTYFWIFLGIEFLQLSGEFCSNFAMSLGPVSLVAAIESLQPMILLILSAGIFIVGRIFFRKKENVLRNFFLMQFQNFPLKIVAMICMGIGVLLIE